MEDWNTEQFKTETVKYRIIPEIPEYRSIEEESPVGWMTRQLWDGGGMGGGRDVTFIMVRLGCVHPGPPYRALFASGTNRKVAA